MEIMEEQVRRSILEVLLKEKIYKTASELPEIFLDTNLQSIGMTSISFIHLIVFLETNYLLEFNDEDLLFENFSSINQIIKTLNKYKEV